MFERFTEPARQVVVLAQDEAQALQHDYIGTEHLLLGLLRQEGVAAGVLESLSVTLDVVRAQVAQIVGRGEGTVSGQVPFTPRAKKVLELSLREALSLGHDHIGTEHLLLGLAREHDGVAMQILRDAGADAETIRNEVIGVLSPRHSPGRARTRMPRSYPAMRRGPPPLRTVLVPVLTGWLLGVAGLGLGVLVGWAIWGT